MGSTADPIEGIASTRLHLDSIHSRTAPLAMRVSHWTIEGDPTVSGSRRTLDIKVARLGSADSDSSRVMAFVGEKITSSWRKVTFAFAPQDLAPMKPAEVRSLTFSKELAGEQVPARGEVYFALVLGTDGEVEQGVCIE